MAALTAAGVRFEYQTSAAGWQRSGDRVTAVVDRTGRVHGADRFVIAAASDSPLIARELGLRLPVRPAKGYSVTLPVAENSGAPSVPVIDNGMHIAVVPVGNDRIRVAGTAEFAGYDRQITPSRIANLLGLLRQIYPHYAATLAPESVQPWTGLRPMCPDGIPLIGATRIPGVYLNTGHGQIGWTVAAGSAKLAADIVLENSTDIDPAPYALSRF